MNPDQVFAIVIVAISGSVVLSLAKMWLGRPKAQLGPVDQRLRAIEDRLQRMEQAIDTIAVEAERISEGQRFTSKLLADRAPDGAPR
jgi:hypothetical protein